MTDDHEEELSLEDLGAAYARAAAQHDPESFVDPDQSGVLSDVETSDDHSGSGRHEAALDAREGGSDIGERNVSEEDSPRDLVTPEAIVEAALFVGHPRNVPLTLERLSSLMRDVSPEEIKQIIDDLNASYQGHDQALRIVADEHGYKMAIAPEVEGIRRSFMGKIRETRLSQAMIEVLSLVAYQPGITTQKVQDQRGRDSGSLLSQLVRRRLLELRRETDATTGKKANRYFPTERFLTLFGLEGLDDLPHVEENLAGQSGS